ncbi:hypothetical protein D3C85_1564630 [compost metagenome]
MGEKRLQLRDQPVDRLVRLLALSAAVQGAPFLQFLDSAFQVRDVLGEVDRGRGGGVRNVQLLILAEVFRHAPRIIDQRVERVDVKIHLLLRGFAARRLGGGLGSRIVAVRLVVATGGQAESGGECERDGAGAGT